MLLLQVDVAAEGRCCGIYISSRVHIGTKKSSCALRYIWGTEFTSHCKSETLHLCRKIHKGGACLSDRENPGEVPAGNKAVNVASVLGKKNKTQMKFFGSSTHLNRFVFEECVQKILELPKALLTQRSSSLYSSVTGDITGGNLPVSHFSLFSGPRSTIWCSICHCFIISHELLPVFFFFFFLTQQKIEKTEGFFFSFSFFHFIIFSTWSTNFFLLTRRQKVIFK